MVAKLTNVKAVKAHILNGQVVLDEPVELPEGTAVEVLVPENAQDVEPTPEEFEQLSREIDLSYAEYERGEVVNAREFMLSLKSRR